MKLILLFVTLFCFGELLGQAQEDKSPAQKNTEMLVVEYNLNSEQAAEMQKVQERKLRNMKEFEPLMSQDVNMYLRKLRALVSATDASFRRILNEEQLAVYNQKLSLLRTEKAQRYKELKAAGVSSLEIDRQLIQMDLEAL